MQLPAQQSDTLQLLNNKYIEHEATIALDSMYNFNFKAAALRFYWLRQAYPEHPMPYFLFALGAWWRMMPDTDVRRHDKTFLRYMDTSIHKAKQLMDEGVRTEGAFFLSAAYAFLARFYGEQEAWLKAAWAGRNALQYLEISQEKKYLSAELLLGDAIYNYYSIWIRENYPQLKLLLSFFKKGDQPLGLKQLDHVAKHAFYVRIEAQYFLMRILNEETERKSEALHIASYLHQKYPNNAYFHRYYARMLYEVGSYSACKLACESIFARIQAEDVGYEGNSGRYCSFFLGWIHQVVRHEPQAAKRYYTRGLRYAKQVGAAQMGYTLYSLLALGDIAVKEKRYERAAACYEKVISLAEQRNNARKQAKLKLKELREQHKAEIKARRRRKRQRTARQRG